MKPQRIAIVGPESTGKSRLSQELAHHYNTVWVPEYAREYLNELGRPYQKEDLLKIAEGQLRQEDELAASAGKRLFCDTNLIVIKIWSDVKYGECDARIVKWMNERRYDLHLLTDVDLPWEDDPLREHPEMRERLFELYEAELKTLNVDYKIVCGTHEKRLENAVKAVEDHFSG